MQNQILTWQSAATGKGLVLSHEGGEVFAVDPMTHVERFLILGSTSTFYAGAFEVTNEAVTALDKAITADARAVFDLTADVIRKNRAMKKDPAIYALARLSLPSVPLDVRRDVAAAIPELLSIGTDLLHWISYRRNLSGGKSNRLFRKAIQQWFESRDPATLALQAVKYDQRDGWSLRDALRLARPKGTGDHAMIYDWIAHPDNRQYERWAGGHPEIDRLFTAYRALRTDPSPEMAGAIVGSHRAPREAVPAPLLAHREVWEALFPDMPGMALIRNLGKLQNVGVFDSEENVTLATEKIVKAAGMLHPFHFLIAGSVYRRGRGVKGKLTWEPNQSIADATAEAFGLAFGTLPVNDRIRPLIALDISGSMEWSNAGGTVLTCVQAEAALAMVLAHQFPKAEFCMFSHGLQPFGVVGGYDDIVAAIDGSAWSGGGTFLDLPLEFARRRWLRQQVGAGFGDPGPVFDAVVTITDSETWHRDQSPASLVEEIHELNPEFRHAVVAMATNGISVADPKDPKQMDFCGLDASLPIALAGFLNGDW